MKVAFVATQVALYVIVLYVVTSVSVFVLPGVVVLLAAMLVSLAYLAIQFFRFKAGNDAIVE